MTCVEGDGVRGRLPVQSKEEQRSLLARQSAGIGNNLAAAQGAAIAGPSLLLLLAFLGGSPADGSHRIAHGLGVAVGVAIGVTILLQGERGSRPSAWCQKSCQLIVAAEGQQRHTQKQAHGQSNS